MALIILYQVINYFTYIKQQIMNLLFWRHKEKGHVIKETCLKKLPKLHNASYYQTVEQPTHYYNDDSSLLTSILVDQAVSDNSGSTYVSDSSSDTMLQSDSFGGYGGGDFGGGGSSDSY